MVYIKRSTIDLVCLFFKKTKFKKVRDFMLDYLLDDSDIPAYMPKLFGRKESIVKVATECLDWCKVKYRLREIDGQWMIEILEDRNV